MHRGEIWRLNFRCDPLLPQMPRLRLFDDVNVADVAKKIVYLDQSYLRLRKLADMSRTNAGRQNWVMTYLWVTTQNCAAGPGCDSVYSSCISAKGIPVWDLYVGNAENRMASEARNLAEGSLPLDKISRVLELSDELQKLIFHPDQAILNRIVSGVADLVNSESCGIFLAAESSNLHLRADFSQKCGYDFEPVSVRIEAVPGGGLTGYFAFKGEIVSLYGPELLNHPYRKKDGGPARHLVSGVCESLLVIPLIDRKGRLLGMLNAHNKKDRLLGQESGGAPFTAIDLAIARLLAGSIVPVLQTHRLIAAFRGISNRVYSAQGLMDVVDEVCKNAKELLAADACEIVMAEGSYQHFLGAHNDFLSEISDRLGPQERTFGTLIARARRGQAFDEQDKAILQLLAEQASTAIETVQKETHFRATVKEASLSGAVPDEILERILQGARRFGFDAGLVYVADHRGQRLRLLRTFGCDVSAETLSGFYHAFDSHSFAAKVFRSKDSQYSHEPWSDPDVDSRGLKTFHIKSPLVGTPMLYQGEPAGVLVCWTNEHPPIQEENKRILDDYASIAGPLLGLAQLREQRLKELEEIGKILESMHESPSIALHIPLILDCLRRRHFDRVRYYTWSEETSEFSGVTSVGMEPVPFSGHRIAVAESKHAQDIYAWALTSTAAKEYQPGTPEIDTQAGPLGKNPELPFVIVPLVVDSKIFGTIVADNTPTGRKIVPEALMFMSHMGAIASQLIAYASNHENFLVETFHMVRSPAHSVSILLDEILENPSAVGENERTLLRDAYGAALGLARLALVVDKVVGSRTARTVEDLGELIETIVQRFTPIAKKSGVTLVTDLEARSYPVTVDREGILVAMNSLLENAIAFSDPGHVITLRLRAEAGKCHVCVIDQGPGVPQERRKGIFEARVSRPPKGKPPGNGIGLWIAWRLVEAHVGTLAYSVPASGKGASFCITLNETTKMVDTSREDTRA